MKNISVRAIASRLQDQFGVEMPLFEVASASRDALRKMGMIASSRFIVLANVENFCVQVPSNVWKVRGVMRLDGLPSPSGTIRIQDTIDFPPQIIFSQEEVSVVEAPILLKSNYVPQLKGPWIDYVWECPKLSFNETDVLIAIECSGVAFDESETPPVPMIPEAAFFGCLYYTLFVYYQPLFIRGQVSPDVFREIKEWKRKNMGQSITTASLEGLTSNEMDKLFDIMTSFDRKQHGTPS